MRLQQLLVEDETITLQGKRTVTLSMADLYDMTNQIPPMEENKNGRMVALPGFYDQITVEVGNGPGQIKPEIASSLQQFEDGGRMPGLLKDSDGNIRPYDENSTLQDLAWTIAAGTTELASSWNKGGAFLIDRAMNGLGVYDGLKLNKAASSTKDDKAFLDKATEWLENKTDQSFRDNVDATSMAVNSWSDFGTLLTGNTGFNIEGAAGIIMGELPSEIVDWALVISTGPFAGMATTGVLNALEAGGAASQSIRDRIDLAFDKGKLQQQPQYVIALEAARLQLEQEQPDLINDPDILQETASGMAREFITERAIKNAYYNVALTGGVIDATSNQILYNSKIKVPFLSTALGKASVGILGEGASGYTEQVFENLGIMNAAGNITYKTEGAVNAAYNEALAGTSGAALGTAQDIGVGTINTATRVVRGSKAIIRKYMMGGQKDVRALVNLLGSNPNALITRITDENGKLQLRKIVSERLVTTEMLQGARVNRRGEFTVKLPDGSVQKVTRKQAQENDKNLRLLGLLDTIDIDPKENVAVATLKDEAEIRQLAQLLGMDKDKAEKGNINAVMADLEEVRKIDVRIEGRSNLEAPIWSDLNERQRHEYWKTGKVRFVGDTERSGQVWTRQQIMFNSRRNNDAIPEKIANLADNVATRPDINSPEYADMLRTKSIAQEQIDIANKAAERNLEQKQRAWDNNNPDADPNNPDNPRPTKENLEAKGEYYIGTQQIQISTAQAQIKKIDDSIKEDTDFWDENYSETHNSDGSARLNKRFVNPKLAEIQDKIARDNQDSAEEAMGLNQVPHAPSLNPNDETTRKHIAANVKIKIGSSEIKASEIQNTINALEKTYPGISEQIGISPSDIEILQKGEDASIKEFQNRVAPTLAEIPNKDEKVVSPRPPKGVEVNVEGTTYRFLGRMWAPVKPNGELGSTGEVKINKELNRLWNEQNVIPTLKDGGKLKDVPILDKKPPEVEIVPAENPNVNINVAVPNVSGTTFANPNVSSTDVKPNIASAPGNLTTTQSSGSQPNVNTTSARASNVTSITPRGPAGGAGTVTQMKTLNQAIANVQASDPRFNNPQLKNALEQYLKQNPNIAQQAANDDRAPSNNKIKNIAKNLAKSTLGRVLGPVAAILTPNSVADATISDSQQAIFDFQASMLRDNPVALKNLYDQTHNEMSDEEKREFDLLNSNEYKRAVDKIKQMQNKVAQDNQRAQQQAAGDPNFTGQTTKAEPPKLTPRQKDAIAGRGEFAPPKRPNIGKSPVSPTAPNQFNPNVPQFTPFQEPKLSKQTPKLTSPEKQTGTAPQLDPTTPGLTKAQKDAIAKIAQKQQQDYEKAAGITEPGVDDKGVTKDIVPEPVTGTSRSQLSKDQKDAIAGRGKYKYDQPPDDTDDAITKDLGPIVAPKTQSKTQTKVEPKAKSKIQTKQKKKSTIARTLRGKGFGLGGDKKKDPIPLPKYTPMKIDDPLRLDKYRQFGQDRGF